MLTSSCFVLLLDPRNGSNTELLTLKVSHRLLYCSQDLGHVTQFPRFAIFVSLLFRNTWFMMLYNLGSFCFMLFLDSFSLLHNPWPHLRKNTKKAIKVNNTSTSTAHVKRITILLYTLWLYMQWRRKQMESVHVCEWGMGG